MAFAGNQNSAALARCKDELHNLNPDLLPKPFANEDALQRRPQADQEMAQLKIKFIEECTSKHFLQGSEEADSNFMTAPGGRLNAFGPASSEVEKLMKRTKEQNRAIKEEIRKEADAQYELYEKILAAHQELKAAREKGVQELRSANLAEDTLSKVQASSKASTKSNSAPVDAQLEKQFRSDEDFGAKLRELREENDKRADEILFQEKEKQQLDMQLEEQRRLEGPLKARVKELQGFQNALDQIGLIKLGISYRDGKEKPQFKVSVPNIRREATVSTQFDPHTGQLKRVSIEPKLNLDKECRKAVEADDLPQLLTEVANHLENPTGHRGGA